MTNYLLLAKRPDGAVHSLTDGADGTCCVAVSSTMFTTTTLYSNNTVCLIKVCFVAPTGQKDLLML